MTTFVPGFDFDVFVSYARRNNQNGALDGQYGWVTRFQANLKRILEEKCPDVRVFFDDAAIAGNDDLDDRVVMAAQRSAILIVILSPVYLTRPYCTKERELFCGRIKDEKTAISRVFVVHYDDVPLEERPPLLSRPKGYAFFECDHINANFCRPLDDTSSKKRKDKYDDCLYVLCGEIAHKLKELKSSVTNLPLAPAGTAATNGQPVPMIFLAEATPDLRGKKDRWSVEAALRQVGFRVLPETTYERSNLTVYQETLDEDLQKSSLFVQILGESSSGPSKDLPHGYEGFQFARAKAAGKLCLRWRPKDLDLDAVRQFAPDYHRYITDEDLPDIGELQQDERVQAGFLEDFKRTIEETMRKVLARQAKPFGNQRVDSRAVLLSPQKVDEKLAQQFDQQVRQAFAVMSDMADDAYTLPDVYENEAGLVVVYGNSTYDWVKERVRQCREIALNRANNPPVCAIYIGPPDAKPPLPKRPANFHVIHHDDPAALEVYLKEVTGTGVAP